MAKPLIVDPNRLVIFDIETGGLIKERHPIIQIGLMAIDGATLACEDIYQAKILFKEENADPKALEMNHYDPVVWEAEGQPPKKVAEDMNSFFKRHQAVSRMSKKGSPYGLARLCGWNAARFDAPFLAHWFTKRLRMFMAAEFMVLDGMQAAMWLQFRDGFPAEPQPFNLKETCDRLGIDYDDEEAHDALYDCGKTLEVLGALDLRVTGDGSASTGNEGSVGREVSGSSSETAVQERLLPS